MLIAITGRFQSHRTQQIRRFDTAEAAVGLLMLDQPSLGGAIRALTNTLRRMPSVKPHHSINLIEDVAQRECRRALRLFKVGAFRSDVIQLRDEVLIRKLLYGTKRLQERERDERAARP